MKLYYLVQFRRGGNVAWGAGENLNEAILVAEDQDLGQILPQTEVTIDINVIPDGEEDVKPQPNDLITVSYRGELHHMYHGEARHILKPRKDARAKEINGRKR